MLAQLLRRLLYVQMLIGAGLGYWLADGMVAMLVGALALPIAVVLVSDIYGALRSRAEAPWAHWWRALLGEMGAGVLFFLWRQPWAGTPAGYQPATGGPARIPVVLVHGYVCNHRLWDAMAKHLRAHGHAVLAVDLEPVFASIDDYAPVIEEAVTTLLLNTGQTQVALVGHSMGGLALRAWLRKHGSARVARVITLGTPHAGTHMAKHAPTPNARQMRWNSDWLQLLGQSEDAAVRSLFRIAITLQDNIVYPQQAQTLPGVTPVVFNGMGHLQMCLDSGVRQWVTQELQLGA
jgi:triacylglycerol lipase